MLERENVIQYPLNLEFSEDIFENLPYSDFSIWTEEDGIHNAALKHLPLGRLNHVKALSFLSYIGPDPKHTIFLEYTHTRFDHSLTVSLIMGQILRQNGFPQEEITKGTIAGFIHDIATPAYGDATKKVDPQALDEEKFWWETIGQKGQEFLTKFGTKEEFDQIINNGGVLGQVLDIADRVTYTMKDLNAIIADKGESQDSSVPTLNPYLLPLRYILSHHPRIGNIYKEVGVDRKKQKVFFNNPKNLGIFLLLRAHLHKNLYLNPTNQGRDLFINQLIRPFYSRDDENAILTPQRLREMTDLQLLQVLQKQYRLDNYSLETFYQNLVNWHPRFERFENLEKAEAYAEELKKKKGSWVIGVSTCKSFDPATSYEVADTRGNILPFREFDPKAAREIEEIAESTKGAFVFFTDSFSDSNPNFIFTGL